MLLALCLAFGGSLPLHAQEAANSAESTPQIVNVVISARKREEPDVAVPAAVTTFSAQAIDAFDIRSFNDYAALTPDLSFSYGGGATGFASARTVAIRGISGQNLAGTAGATGLYIDDTPVPISIDPRVLDVHDIEVLKGPQGTLYGESALGGNIRMVVNRPSLNADALDITTDAGGTTGAAGPDLGVSSITNLVLIPGELALRAVVFGDHDVGYLSRTYPQPDSVAVADPFAQVPRTRVGNQGANTSYGGSITALWRASDSLDLQLRVLGERQAYNGFPVAFAPLPSFRPVYTLDRAFDVRPSATDEWTLSALELTYRGVGWTLVSSSSFFARDAEDIEDSTYGTQQVLTSVYGGSGLPAQPYLWTGQHSDRQVTSETRLSFEPVRHLSGTIGVFYSDARNSFYVPPVYANGLVAATAADPITGPASSDLLWTQSNPGTQQDESVFGELYYQVSQPITVTLGARQYWLRQSADYTADGYLNLGPTLSDPQHNRQSGFDPKYVVSYQPSSTTEFYMSAAKGFRAGGAQPYAPFCTLPNLPVEAISEVRSDTLWSFEAGTKVQLSDPDLLITAAAYHIDWSNLQQEVALPCGAYFELNGKAAQISGGETAVVGELARGFEIRLGAGYERTSLTEPGALADAGVQPDTRISGIPTWTVSTAVSYHRTLSGAIEGFVTSEYSYTGDSVSLLNGGAGAVATRPSYSLVNLRFGVRRRASELSVSVRNLTDIKPNLGDIGYIGYAQHAANGSVIPQVATLAPLTVILQLRHSF
jgi:outer membrane receptor protein involved in Fe transport